MGTLLASGELGEAWVDADFADVADVRALERSVAASSPRYTRAASALSQTLAIERQRLARRLATRDRRVARRLMAKDHQLEERTARATAGQRRELEDARQRLDRAVARASRRGLWNGAVVLSALPLAAIYGRQSRDHNLALLASQLLFLFGDEISELLSGMERGKAANVGSSDLWLYLAPVANLVAGHWLLGNRQHEKFVTGLADEFELEDPAVAPAPRRDREGGSRRRAHRSRVLPSRCEEGEASHEVSECCWTPPRRIERYVAEVDLAHRVAPDFVVDLLTLTDLPVVATVADLEWADTVADHDDARVSGISAQVESGKLHLELQVTASPDHTHPPCLLESVQVAWMVAVL